MRLKILLATLGLLLLSNAFAAAIVGLWWLHPLAALALLWPAVLLLYPLGIIGILYDRGYTRAYSIGSLTSSIFSFPITGLIFLFLLSEANVNGALTEVESTTVTAWLVVLGVKLTLAIVSGILSVAFCWCLGGPRSQQAVSEEAVSRSHETIPSPFDASESPSDSVEETDPLAAANSSAETDPLAETEKEQESESLVDSSLPSKPR
ncbi:MAG: hypothetical protein N2C14_11485 [Planctomycetales bacterium]